MHEQFIDTGKAKIAVREERNSSDEWIVCLHGLQTNKSIFDTLLQRPFFKNYSTLAIDCIGFGHSEKPLDFSYDLQEQATACLAILDTYQIQRCHLIGHSLGGMIGTLLMKPLGDRLVSFTNMEGNFVRSDCGKSADIISITLEDFIQHGYVALLHALRASNEPSARWREAAVQMTPPFVLYRSSQSIVEWSTSNALVSLFNQAKQKRMFMYGSENAAKARSVGPQAKKVEIPHAGHFMMCDNPEATFDAIEKFLL